MNILNNKTSLYTRSSNNRKGFTIVELLIVIVVIGILAAISIVAYNGIQQRARDTQRASDIAQIKKALLAYNVTYGGVVQPTTGYSRSSSEPHFGGWDVSTRANWLVFLRKDHGHMPVDPSNLTPTTDTSSPLSGGNRLYTYFCYNTPFASSDPNSATVRLEYRLENGSTVSERIRVDSCLTTIPS